MFVQRIMRNAVQRRNFMKSAVRRSDDHHDLGGEPGKNVPFNIHNRFGMTLLFTIFISSGMAIPFFAIRHQILK